jgi:hypothetical protein
MTVSGKQMFGTNLLPIAKNLSKNIMKWTIFFILLH